MVNINVVKDIIEENGYDIFAVCEHTQSNNKSIFFISPIIFKSDKIIRCSAIFDNLDRHGKVIMSKEEMIMKFILIFGHSVDYYLNEDNGDFRLNV